MQVCFFFLVFVNGSFLKTIVNKKTPENQGEAQQEVKMLSLRHHCCASSEAQASLDEVSRLRLHHPAWTGWHGGGIRAVMRASAAFSCRGPPGPG